MIEIVTAISIWELVKHTSTWIGNLRRAKDARKEESKGALQKVKIATRRTSIYLRHLVETGVKSYKDEMELAILWTELSYDLDKLGLEALAKRCRIKGKYWEAPDKMDKDFLEKADVGLVKMEALANELLIQIGR